MRKSILALAAAVAAVTFVEAPAADARGIRIGLGVGSGGLSPLADSSILERARIQQEKNARGRQSHQPSRQIYSSQPSKSSQAAERRAAAAAAAAAASAKRQAAAQAAAKARAESAAAAQAARRAKAKQEVVKAPVAPPQVTAAPATIGNQGLEAAQQEQRAKAEELLRKLNGQQAQPTQTTLPATAAPQQPAKIVVAPAVEREPARTQVVNPAPSTAATPASASTPGDCRRFIPGAGVTVRVPCTE